MPRRSRKGANRYYGDSQNARAGAEGGGERLPRVTSRSKKKSAATDKTVRHLRCAPRVRAFKRAYLNARFKPHSMSRCRKIDPR